MEGFPLGLNREKVQSGDDKLVWVGARDGIFSIKRLYDCLELRRLVDFPSKVIWKSWAPSKVTFFFAWEATWSRILLQRGGDL